MSVGDWLTLNPLNLKNYQTDIDNLTSRVTNVETTLTQLDNQVQGMVFQIINLQDQVLANTTTIQSLNTNVSSLTNNLNSLTSQLNGIKNNITNLTNLYQPIAWFDTPNVRFTDLAGDTVMGNVSGAWHQPIKLLQGGNNDGVDLKFLILVLRAISISPLNPHVNYNSDPIPLPIPFVNNNNYGVFWSSSL
jgi:uncharacterized phage infection (PIP) family protein YhgE